MAVRGLPFGFYDHKPFVVGAVVKLAVEARLGLGSDQTQIRTGARFIHSLMANGSISSASFCSKLGPSSVAPFPIHLLRGAGLSTLIYTFPSRSCTTNILC